MECAAEREFCSNFKCCNVALPDMHALFDHFERFHPSGRVPSPIPFWDDYRPSASSVVDWPLGTEECEDWAPREEDPPLSPATSDCSLSSSASSASSSTLSTPEPQVLADALCSIATGCVVPAAVPAPVPVSMSMTTFSLLQPREYVPQTEDVFVAPSPSSKKKVKRAKMPKGRARAGLPETEGAASILVKTLQRNLSDKVRAAAVVGESPEKADSEPPASASASASPTCHEFVLDLTPGSTPTTATMDDILRSDPPKPVQYLNGQPKTYVCPVPQCFKAYLNPNGLRYHIEHGQCSDAHGAVCPPALTAPYRREYLAAHGSPSSAAAAGRLRAGSSKRGRGRYERTPVRQSPRFGKFRNGFAVEMELVRAVEAVRAAEVDAGSQSDSDSDSEMGTG
ncbi:unnamed protein product [Mycena citricolor]|uniref:C2H2-type domain-containing protein n=1 Tax=Mycena citricolor TaxID=2018698 RepID=A0AAD2H2P8_9AGAR|nr:unnamed protein product [Mycena citricolor]